MKTKKMYQQPIAEIVDSTIEESILTTWSTDHSYDYDDPLDNHTGDLNEDPFGGMAGAKGNPIFDEVWEDELQ